jgi:hypothetical protein
MENFLTTEYFDLLTGRRLLVIFHLFGLAIGAGAAFASDFLFTHTLKDRVVNAHQLAVLKHVSTVVWIGLTVLVVSGGLIFLGDSERLLDSTKFLAKMTIIGVLMANGLLFHFKHMPLLETIVGQDIRELNGISLQGMFISGAVSGVSWASALILGALYGAPYGYLTIMGVYLLLVVVAISSALLLAHYYTDSSS